jgi:hypothetical protein
VTDSSRPPSENPFATRFTRPGAIAFLFPPGVTAEDLVEQLESFDWRGQIIGPHGSGKTTLLHALTGEIERRSRSVHWITLHDRQRTVPIEELSGLAIGGRSLLIVDGYEQLSWLGRWRIGRQCRKLDCGLLVTAHRDIGLPTILEVAPRLQVFQQLARQLVAEPGWSISDEQLAAIFEKHGRNIRESLFELYDLYDRHNRSSSPARH